MYFRQFLQIYAEFISGRHSQLSSCLTAGEEEDIRTVWGIIEGQVL